MTRPGHTQFYSPVPSVHRQQQRVWCTILLLANICLVLLTGLTASAQTGEDQQPAGTTGTVSGGTGERIAVNPQTSDAAIGRRLSNILEATGWFAAVEVTVEDGIVFLDGKTTQEKQYQWAGEVAGKVADVVAVVNRIEVVEQSIWDLTPVFSELGAIWRAFLKMVPRLLLTMIAFALFLLLVRFVVNKLRGALNRRLKPLLRDVTSRIIVILATLVGIYLALKIAGLTGLAATVLGGTGIAGLVAGIAFRDILENYLASILISLRNPFRIGDLVEIKTHTGFVEKVTTRGTVLMNLDGNHVQIPNAIVYKSIIRNYTANPKRRELFEVGIGFENEAAEAQQLALNILLNHPAVFNDPEPLVLVDRLGSATVNMKIYFWYDGLVYNGLKLKSSLIRMVKSTFEKAHISMPDEAREIIFPEGVPVHMVEEDKEPAEQSRQRKQEKSVDQELSTRAEGSLTSEEKDLRGQAKTSRIPEEGNSLLSES